MADGGWYERDRIVAQLLSLVPPGRATRQAESERARVRGGVAPRRVQRSPEFVQRVGARSVVMDSLTQVCERRVVDGTVMIRLRSAARESKEAHL